MEKEHGSKLFLVFLLCAAFLLLKLFSTFIVAIVLALLITSAFYPMYPIVKRLFKGRDLFASLAMVIIIMLLLAMNILLV